MFWKIALPIAGGLFNWFGSRRRNNYQNQLLRQQWEQRQKIRERRWYQALSIYGAKKVRYAQGIDEDWLAAARGYEQAQEGLNRMKQSAFQTNEKALKKYFEGAGQYAAAGMTGQSARRLELLRSGDLSRVAGRLEHSLTEGGYQYKGNVASISRQYRARVNKRFADVAMTPIQDAEIPQPVYHQSPWWEPAIQTGFDIFGAFKGFGLIGSGFGMLPGGGGLFQK